MKRFWKNALWFIFGVAIIAAVLLPGCAAVLRLQGQAAEKAAQAVSAYCENTDAAFRASFRTEVNAKAAPNSVEITCQ